MDFNIGRLRNNFSKFSLQVSSGYVLWLIKYWDIYVKKITIFDIKIGGEWHLLGHGCVLEQTVSVPCVLCSCLPLCFICWCCKQVWVFSFVLSLTLKKRYLLLFFCHFCSHVQTSSWFLSVRLLTATWLLPTRGCKKRNDVVTSLPTG